MQIPTLIDNVDGNTLLKVLESLLVKSVNLDIATGTFEIGAFLSLGKTWQHLDGIRLLMGDETTRRTKEHLIEALQEVTDDNIESVKETGRYPPRTCRCPRCNSPRANYGTRV